MVKIVFFGTPDIALRTFQHLCKKYSVLALVSQPSKVCTRGNKITDCNLVKAAKDLGMPVYQPEKISADRYVIEELKRLKPDFFVTFAFGQILSQEILDIAPTINIHASLLPLYRGACPICHAIINGDTFSGITTVLTELKMDAGDILLQEEFNIEDMDAIDLTETISYHAPALIEQTLDNFEILPRIKQIDALATYAPKLKKEDRLIDWNTVTRNQIWGNVGYNTMYFLYKGKRVQVLECDYSNVLGDKGIVLSLEDGVHISGLKLITVKPEGKGEMSARDWANGVRLTTGTRL